MSSVKKCSNCQNQVLTENLNSESTSQLSRAEQFKVTLGNMTFDQRDFVKENNHRNKQRRNRQRVGQEVIFRSGSQVEQNIIKDSVKYLSSTTMQKTTDLSLSASRQSREFAKTKARPERTYKKNIFSQSITQLENFSPRRPQQNSNKLPEGKISNASKPGIELNEELSEPSYQFKRNKTPLSITNMWQTTADMASAVLQQRGRTQLTCKSQGRKTRYGMYQPEQILPSIDIPNATTSEHLLQDGSSMSVSELESLAAQARALLRAKRKKLNQVKPKKCFEKQEHQRNITTQLRTKEEWVNPTLNDDQFFTLKHFNEELEMNQISRDMFGANYAQVFERKTSNRHFTAVNDYGQKTSPRRSPRMTPRMSPRKSPRKSPRPEKTISSALSIQSRSNSQFASHKTKPVFQPIEEEEKKLNCDSDDNVTINIKEDQVLFSNPDIIEKQLHKTAQVPKIDVQKMQKIYSNQVCPRQKKQTRQQVRSLSRSNERTMVGSASKKSISQGQVFNRHAVHPTSNYKYDVTDVPAPCHHRPYFTKGKQDFAKPHEQKKSKKLSSEKENIVLPKIVKESLPNKNKSVPRNNGRISLQNELKNIESTTYTQDRNLYKQKQRKFQAEPFQSQSIKTPKEQLDSQIASPSKISVKSKLSKIKPPSAKKTVNLANKKSQPINKLEKIQGIKQHGKGPTKKEGEVIQEITSEASENEEAVKVLGVQQKKSANKNQEDKHKENSIKAMAKELEDLKNRTSLHSKKLVQLSEQRSPNKDSGVQTRSMTRNQDSQTDLIIQMVSKQVPDSLKTKEKNQPEVTQITSKKDNGKRKDEPLALKGKEKSTRKNVIETFKDQGVAQPQQKTKLLNSKDSSKSKKERLQQKTNDLKKIEKISDKSDPSNQTISISNEKNEETKSQKSLNRPSNSETSKRDPVQIFKPDSPKQKEHKTTDNYPSDESVKEIEKHENSSYRSSPIQASNKISINNGESSQLEIQGSSNCLNLISDNLSQHQPQSTNSVKNSQKDLLASDQQTASVNHTAPHLLPNSEAIDAKSTITKSLKEQPKYQSGKGTQSENSVKNLVRTQSKISNKTPYEVNSIQQLQKDQTSSKRTQQRSDSQKQHNNKLHRFFRNQIHDYGQPDKNQACDQSSGLESNRFQQQSSDSNRHKAFGEYQPSMNIDGSKNSVASKSKASSLKGTSSARISTPGSAQIINESTSRVSQKLPSNKQDSKPLVVDDFKEEFSFKDSPIQTLDSNPKSNITLDAKPEAKINSQDCINLKDFFMLYSEKYRIKILMHISLLMQVYPHFEMQCSTQKGNKNCLVINGSQDVPFQIEVPLEYPEKAPLISIQNKYADQFTEQKKQLNNFPYIVEWDCRFSNLTGLVQQLLVIFNQVTFSHDPLVQYESASDSELKVTKIGKKRMCKVDPELHFGRDDQRAKEAFELIKGMKENIVVTDYMKNSDRHIKDIIKDLLTHVNPKQPITEQVIEETIANFCKVEVPSQESLAKEFQSNLNVICPHMPTIHKGTKTMSAKTLMQSLYNNQRTVQVKRVVETYPDIQLIFNDSKEASKKHKGLLIIPFWVKKMEYDVPLFLMLCISKEFPYERPEMKIIYPNNPVHEQLELKSKSTRDQTWTKYSRLLAFIRAIQKDLDLLLTSEVSWAEIVCTKEIVCTTEFRIWINVQEDKQNREEKQIKEQNAELQTPEVLPNSKQKQGLFDQVQTSKRNKNLANQISKTMRC